MKMKSLKLFLGLSLTALLACSQGQAEKPVSNVVSKSQNQLAARQSHNFGGWYCPDNLNGFPAVNIANWDQVPVIDGRLPTEAEAKSEASLIYVKKEEYPNAISFYYNLPRLATFNSPYTKREEVIIVIQAIQVGVDSILGFRYLNGGNGSAMVNEVNFITPNELPVKNGRFISFSTQIKAASKRIQEVMTESKYLDQLESTFNSNNNLPLNWRKESNLNYHDADAGKLVSDYANMLFGNYYVQNDYDSFNYTEKFMLIQADNSGFTELKVMCGPFEDKLNIKEKQLKAWAAAIKKISEKKE